jgi:hypothetical protein
MSHKIDCLECFIQGELQGEKTGALVELERIIELLESRKQHEALASIDQSAYRMNLMLDLTIALIKGEK